jgi:hypothetical protein
LPTSLRQGVDPKTGALVVRPRPALPEPAWKSVLRGQAADAFVQPDWPDEGTYPERVIDELALHQAIDPQAITVLPTTQSYDHGNIAVIEDDGTILIPTGANVRIDAPALTRKFIAIHNDEYDDICVFAASNITNLTLGGGFAYELNVKNTITGLGISQFDFSASYGSPGGVLCSYQNFNKSRTTRPIRTRPASWRPTPAPTMTHETGHRSPPTPRSSTATPSRPRSWAATTSTGASSSTRWRR